MTLGEVIAAIEDGLVDEHLREVFDACNRRSAMLRQRKSIVLSKEMKIGDRVMLTSIRPRYLEGAVGVIVARGEGTKFVVDLDERCERFHRGVRIEAGNLVVRDE